MRRFQKGKDESFVCESACGAVTAVVLTGVTAAFIIKALGTNAPNGAIQPGAAVYPDAAASGVAPSICVVLLALGLQDEIERLAEQKLGHG